VERVGVVLMTADRGLCGSFNVNLINTAVKFIREKEAAGIEVSLICVGRKGRDFFRRRKRRCWPNTSMCGISLTFPTP